MKPDLGWCRGKNLVEMIFPGKVILWLRGEGELEKLFCKSLLEWYLRPERVEESPMDREGGERKRERRTLRSKTCLSIGINGGKDI